MSSASVGDHTEEIRFPFALPVRFVRCVGERCSLYQSAAEPPGGVRSISGERVLSVRDFERYVLARTAACGVCRDPRSDLFKNHFDLVDMYLDWRIGMRACLYLDDKFCQLAG